MEPRTPRLYHVREGSAPASAFTAFAAVGIVCAATATMLVGAIVVHGSGAPVMVTAVVGQVLMLVVPVCVMMASSRTRAAIGLARPRANRYWGAALLIGASAWYLNMRLVEALPLRSEDTQLMNLIDRPSLPVVILAVALAPAICEEVLFRGVLVRALATRFFPLVAVLLGALVFSLYHLRVVQLVPTFTLGLLFGYLALRADSALPGMLAHFVNNAVALVIARGDAPPVANVFGRYPSLALAGCAIATTLGLFLATGWRPQRGETA
jgi:membrane protease YdiL (CAAX protease family)